MGGGLREPREAGGRAAELGGRARAPGGEAGDRSGGAGRTPGPGRVGAPPEVEGGPERPRLRGLGWGRVESQARCGCRQNRPRRDLELGEAGDPGPAA